MNKKLIPTVLAAALLASGCSLIPSLDRPATPVAAQYPVATEQAQQAAADIPWQNFFTDTRLQQLIQTALDNNRDLRVAVLNIAQARALYQIQDAQRFPEVGVSGSATRQRSQITGGYANAFSVGVGIQSWEIDFFGRISSLKEQALAQYLATEEGRKSAQISLVAAVANAWLTLQADEELIDISRRTLETREESIKLSKLRLDAGVASELDYRQAQSLTENAKATLAQQLRQRALDVNALTLLLGQTPPAELLTSLQGKRLSDLPVMADVPAGLPSDLMLRRPDLRQAEQTMIAANANIGAARALFYPAISLTASAGFASSELSDLFDSKSKGFTIAPSLSLPIFNAGRNQANLDIAQANRDAALAQYDKAIQVAFREVSDALADRATMQRRLNAQAALVQAASRVLQLSQARFKAGADDFLTVLDAQRSLYAAQQTQITLMQAEQVNRISLYKALGGGIDSAQ